MPPHPLGGAAQVHQLTVSQELLAEVEEPINEPAREPQSERDVSTHLP